MRRTILFAGCLLLAACTTTGNYDTRMPVMSDLASYESLAVAVTYDPKVRGGGRWNLEQMLVQKLAATGRLTEVVAAQGAREGRHLTLRVNALQMPRGGIVDRSIFAKAVVQLDVELIDNTTGNAIGACTVNTRATMGALWSAAGRRAVSRAVDQVTACVEES